MFRAGLGDQCVRFDSVEIDPRVVALGRGYFGAYPVNGRDAVFSGLDARVFVDRAASAAYDLVLVDAYERQVYVPAHVASVEFFRSVARILRPDGGTVAVNVGGVRFDNPVVMTVANTLAQAFGVSAWVFRVPNTRNFVVIAQRGGSVREPYEVLAEVRRDGAGSVMRANLEVLTRPGHWRSFGADASAAVLTDDRPFLDQMQDGVLARAASLEGDAVRCAGTASAESVDSALYEAYAAGRYEEMFALASGASRDSGYMRMLLGHARWRMRDLAGASAEYEAVDTAAVPLPNRHRDAVVASRRAVAEELVAARAAQRAAERNGWLVVGFGVAVLAVVLACGITTR